MIYSVDFQELCRNISHIDLAKYVTDLNWVAYKGKTANFLKIFQKEYNDNFYQIIIPFNRNLSDYTEAMYKAISVVAITEEKSTEQVILELLNPLSDIIRVRYIGDDVKAGSIQIENGINLYENTKKLLTNAALDILNYKKIYKGRIPENVAEFISNCRYGQTEFGSYVISLVCPFINIENNEVQQLNIFAEEDINAFSFTRKVTNRVIESIIKIKNVIDDGKSLNEIIENDQSPISVSFIDSLANLNIGAENSSLEITVKWAPTIKQNRAEINHAVISHDYYPVLKSVVEKYKSEDASLAVSLVGRISKLIAVPTIEDRVMGQAQLVYIDEHSEAKKIMLNLEKNEYDVAVQAHLTGKAIKASGEIVGKKMINVSIDILE